MTGLAIEVDDQITGYCPACGNQAIEFTCVSIAGNTSYVVHRYAVHCSHQDVCKLRHDYMEGEE